MTGVPSLGDPGDVSEAVVEGAKRLCPWLPDPYKCPECGGYMDVTRTYDPHQAAFYPGGMAPAWACDECDVQVRREGY